MATASLALGAWGKGEQSGGFALQLVEAAKMAGDGVGLQRYLGQDGTQVFCTQMHLTSLAAWHCLAPLAQMIHTTSLSLLSMEWVK